MLASALVSVLLLRLILFLVFFYIQSVTLLLSSPSLKSNWSHFDFGARHGNMNRWVFHCDRALLAIAKCSDSIQNDWHAYSELENEHAALFWLEHYWSCSVCIDIGQSNQVFRRLLDRPQFIMIKCRYYVVHRTLNNPVLFGRNSGAASLCVCVCVCFASVIQVTITMRSSWFAIGKIKGKKTSLHKIT